jgi:glycosyltransferase involved in cell wall biosynthesis
MIYRAIDQADLYIALTTFERDHLLGRGIDPRKIRVIGGAVDAAAFAQADGRAIRAKFGWGEDPVVIGLGRQAERKRFDILIQAMPAVWAARPDARLVLAGGRTYYSDHLNRLIADLPPAQQDRVTIIHGFPEAEKPDILAAADLLVHPTGLESFGLIFLEAWACGKPVIGVRQGPIASVIDEGQNGLLCPYADPQNTATAILTLLADPARSRRMGEAGRQKVLADHTWEIFTDRLRQTLNEVVADYQANRRSSTSAGLSPLRKSSRS